MECPICGTVIPKWLGFGGLEGVIAQCPDYPKHFFFPIELFLEEEFLLEIVTERERRIAKFSVIFIDLGDVEKIMSIGARVAHSIEVTKKEVERLNNKYAPTIKVILEESKLRISKERNFKRRII